MRLAVSNIAWEIREDAEAAAILHRYGAAGVEIAPTKITPNPLSLTVEQAQEYRLRWRRLGLEISSMQALLFGQPDLQLFADQESREQMYQYLCGMIALGGQLGAGALVFGSPKNRRAGELPATKVWSIAVDFFGRLGEVAHRHGTCLCIEPNPGAYGCDFVNTAQDGALLVKEIGSPGFRLHLDIGAMTLNGEDYRHTIEACFPYLGHFHVSAPHLQPIDAWELDHETVSATLRQLGYAGWVSVEMRSPGEGKSLQNLDRALDHVSQLYCG